MMTSVETLAVRLCGSGPQIMIVIPRSMTARPLVTMTIEKIGSPSIGRMKIRSRASPITIAMGIVTIISGTKERPKVLVRVKAT